ncbi:ankyrin repeat domain-containing protein 26-like isoform X4 [Antechinus flavipes]|uniref:ankyrin repeat domain-containing protein 26-like isoform X3 n=1 Tax=Antechinus flavipes TaxID=38775 RepID=UPI0022356104|nr:ankyrin repeat domain-containing protein 26-like isoform X3 [Antechinus flavipes]XP_051856195.1 ankyrin repeat domain-containing protein 26-like isoform X4 [Antechinus flavipes]
MKKFFNFGKKMRQSSSGRFKLPNSCGVQTLCPTEGYQIRSKDLGKIHKAVMLGDVAKVQKLLLLGKNTVNELDKVKRTPLHLACANGYPDVVSLLIERKCELNLLDNDSRTPLMKAIECRQEECVTILLEHGADPNLGDNKKNNALHYIASGQTKFMAEKLIKHNIDIEAKNQEGLTPLLLAITTMNTEMADFLLKNGANVNALDNCKRTALMIAVSVESIDLVTVLLQNNADYTLQDVDGWTAETYAEQHGYPLHIYNKQIEEQQECHNSCPPQIGYEEKPSWSGFALGVSFLDKKAKESYAEDSINNSLSDNPGPANHLPSTKSELDFYTEVKEENQKHQYNKMETLERKDNNFNENRKTGKELFSMEIHYQHGKDEENKIPGEEIPITSISSKGNLVPVHHALKRFAKITLNENKDKVEMDTDTLDGFPLDTGTEDSDFSTSNYVQGASCLWEDQNRVLASELSVKFKKSRMIKFTKKVTAFENTENCTLLETESQQKHQKVQCESRKNREKLQAEIHFPSCASSATFVQESQALKLNFQQAQDEWLPLKDQLIEKIDNLSIQLSKAKDDKHQLCESLKMTTLILEETRRKLKKSNDKIKELEFKNYIQKEKSNRPFFTKEVMQEELTQMPREIHVLQQPFKDAQNKGAFKILVSDDIQVKFSARSRILTANFKKQDCVEKEKKKEEEKESIDEYLHVIEQIYKKKQAEDEDTIRKLQQELADCKNEPCMNSQELTSLYQRVLEWEKQLQKELEQNKRKDTIRKPQQELADCKNEPCMNSQELTSLYQRVLEWEKQLQKELEQNKRKDTIRKLQQELADCKNEPCMNSQELTSLYQRVLEWEKQLQKELDQNKRKDTIRKLQQELADGKNEPCMNSQELTSLYQSVLEWEKQLQKELDQKKRKDTIRKLQQELADCKNEPCMNLQELISLYQRVLEWEKQLQKELDQKKRKLQESQEQSKQPQQYINELEDYMQKHKMKCVTFEDSVKQQMDKKEKNWKNIFDYTNLTQGTEKDNFNEQMEYQLQRLNAELYKMKISNEKYIASLEIQDMGSRWRRGDRSLSELLLEPLRSATDQTTALAWWDIIHKYLADNKCGTEEIWE